MLRKVVCEQVVDGVCRHRSEVFRSTLNEFDNGLNGSSAEVEGAKSIFIIPGRALKQVHYNVSMMYIYTTSESVAMEDINCVSSKKKQWSVILHGCSVQRESTLDHL